MLMNLYDMAYGTKLKRVVQEAEYILEFEKEMLVPPKQAPFHKFYSQVEDTRTAPRVGEYWPFGLKKLLPRQSRNEEE